MHVTTYLSKFLKNHGWERGLKEETKIIELLHPDSAKELETTIGPPNKSESKQLEVEEGFSYQRAINELIFVYVICHLDIGYAVSELSKFNTTHAKCHYKAVKRVYPYIRQTID
eukprot:8232095-Ditylum_brightwellii.AAC.1